MKKRIGILFGGQSAEHEVSLQSAKNVIEALDSNKYEAVLIGIDKEGKWHLYPETEFLVNENDPKTIALKTADESLAFVPGENDKKFISTNSFEAIQSLDAVFPILHGTLGEDGSIQGMLRVADVPFVGSNVLGSAVSMDKDIAKRLLREAGLRVAPSYTFTNTNRDEINYEKIEKQLGLPLFIKPANQGSSVGVSKVETKEQFENGVKEAFRYDYKILIETGIEGREIECSILGNENPKASVPGEILADNNFYSYEAKYIDEKGASLEIPAKLDAKRTEHIQKVAIQAFEALNCEGLARVDVFLTEDGEVVINEINTIPGFTQISMYPKLWEHSGVPYSQLIDELIQLAIERHHRDSNLSSFFE